MTVLVRFRRSLISHAVQTRRIAGTEENMTLPLKVVALLMSFLLVLATIPVDASAQSQSTPAQSASATKGEEYAPLTPDELDGLVAPIALYPDALVAQVLGAATFPYEIVDAVVWLKAKLLPDGRRADEGCRSTVVGSGGEGPDAVSIRSGQSCEESRVDFGAWAKLPLHSNRT